MDRRTESLEIRLHTDERRTIQRAARAAGLSMGEWMRTMALRAAGNVALSVQFARLRRATREALRSKGPR